MRTIEAHGADARIARTSGVLTVWRGCASVDFDGPTSEERSGVIADATGQTPRGGQVGIIVWGRSDAITALEIYDLGAGDHDLLLPVPTSVIPWDRQEAQ